MQDGGLRKTGADRSVRATQLVSYSIQESSQLPRARRMPQLAQCLGFYLPDTFAGYRKRLADFFERVLAAVFQTKAHLDDFLLARRERAQHLRSLVFQVDVDHGFGRRNYAAVLDEVAKVRIFLFADRRFEGDGLLCDLQNFS